MTTAKISFLSSDPFPTHEQQDCDDREHIRDAESTYQHGDCRLEDRLWSHNVEGKETVDVKATCRIHDRRDESSSC